MVRLGPSDLEVFPLCLGGNVFGWTADERQSFAVLDAYAQAGGNFIDSADSYSAFAPGNVGGESEAMLGKWVVARGNRDSVVLATKVGRKPDRKGLSRANILVAVEESLARLQTDYIDLYYAHADDPDTPLEETLRTFDELIRDGKVRYVAASNYSAERLDQALETSDSKSLARYIAVQPHYSLVERDHYEGALAELCERQGLSCVPYWALARGFLTGKYRPGATVDSPRAGQASQYLDDHGIRVLEALDRVAAAHDSTVAAVALAWVAAQPGVAAPIASARNPEQLAEILPAAGLELNPDELRELSGASAQSPAATS
ncbi:MAG TPA: aldo/keto reductase [Solirubrobacteraceae bacterium]|nr:aldo/keto reductase [Solirubrobacteraceae bacterium]